MPFRHPDRAANLHSRIEHEVRERLEEAIDFVCLEALVKARRTAGGAAPVSDSAADRADYQAHVAAFLRRLTTEIAASDSSPAKNPDSELLARQVTLARTMPDYWQRFEAVSARYLAEPPASGSERRGMLARIFGRG
jgi:hypothetical protein